jgi:hypothetical protein
MEIVKVYSPFEDKEIHNNINGSPIWRLVFDTDEVEERKNVYKFMYEYTIMFDGLHPIQVMGVKKIELFGIFIKDIKEEIKKINL